MRLHKASMERKEITVKHMDECLTVDNVATEVMQLQPAAEIIVDRGRSRLGRLSLYRAV